MKVNETLKIKKGDHKILYVECDMCNNGIGIIELDHYYDGCSVNQIAEDMINAGYQNFKVYKQCSNGGLFDLVIDSKDYE